MPAGNPGKITGLADFADESKTIALCAPQVPCGAAAVKVFAAAGITPKPDTLEADVKATLAKVAADEVDAALVYRTDVISEPTKVRGDRLPRGQPGGQHLSDRHPDRVQEPAMRRRPSSTTCCRRRGRPCLEKAGFAKP